MASADSDTPAAAAGTESASDGMSMSVGSYEASDESSPKIKDKSVVPE